MNIIFVLSFLKLDNFNFVSTFLSYNKYAIHTLYFFHFKHIYKSRLLKHYSLSNNKSIFNYIIYVSPLQYTQIISMLSNQHNSLLTFSSYIILLSSFFHLLSSLSIQFSLTIHLYPQ